MNDLNAMIDTYMNHIKKDFAAYARRCGISQRTVDDFNARIVAKPGKKYVKIITRDSVHSFIQIDADAKFAAGDVLKAASWTAPAKNFPRANLNTADFKNIVWTGAH